MKWEVECSETGTDIFQESLIQMRKRNSFFFCFSVVIENELMTLSRNYWHQLKCLPTIYKSLECFLFVQRFMTEAPENHYFREWEFEWLGYFIDTEACLGHRQTSVWNLLQ